MGFALGRKRPDADVAVFAVAGSSTCFNVCLFMASATGRCMEHVGVCRPKAETPKRASFVPFVAISSRVTRHVEKVSVGSAEVENGRAVTRSQR